MKKVTWVLALLLAAFLLFMGSQKFGGPNPVFTYIASTTGFGIFEPGVRMLIGVAEILSGLMLVWPRSRMFGASLALAVLGGALLFHISPFLGINAPVAFAEDDSYVKSPMLFYMASTSFVTLLALVYIERTRKK